MNKTIQKFNIFIFCKTPLIISLFKLRTVIVNSQTFNLQQSVSRKLRDSQMTQLSKYIQKQLATILNKIQQTPPKRSSSMQKIKTLVSQAPISQTQKTSINNSIRKIETAMVGPKRSNRKEAKSHYAKNLFYENMFLEQKNMNQIKKQVNEPQQSQNAEYLNLLERIQSVRMTRLKREEYLNELILKTQRMERLVSVRQDNQDKYLKSKMMEQHVEERRNKEQEIRNGIKEAVKNNKIRSVYTLVSKYNNFIQ